MAPASTIATLPAKAAMLSERTGTENPAFDPRRRSQHGARHREDGCLPDVKARTQEDRDVVRPPQAHPPAWQTAITRTKRRARRVPPRSHRPEPQKARQAKNAGDGDRLTQTAQPTVGTDREIEP